MFLDVANNGRGCHFLPRRRQPSSTFPWTIHSNASYTASFHTAPPLTRHAASVEPYCTAITPSPCHHPT